MYRWNYVWQFYMVLTNNNYNFVKQTGCPRESAVQWDNVPFAIMQSVAVYSDLSLIGLILKFPDQLLSMHKFLFFPSLTDSKVSTRESDKCKKFDITCSVWVNMKKKLKESVENERTHCINLVSLLLPSQHLRCKV